MDLRIECVNKIDRPSPHERILKVGGRHEGAVWKMTQENAIQWIESGQRRFWVAVPGQPSVWVIVAVSRFGNKYLKTQNDGEEPNNLLSLPECP